MYTRPEPYRDVPIGSTAPSPTENNRQHDQARSSTNRYGDYYGNNSKSHRISTDYTPQSLQQRSGFFPLSLEQFFRAVYIHERVRWTALACLLLVSALVALKAKKLYQQNQHAYQKQLVGDIDQDMALINTQNRPNNLRQLIRDASQRATEAGALVPLQLGKPLLLYERNIEFIVNTQADSSMSSATVAHVAAPSNSNTGALSSAATSDSIHDGKQSEKKQLKAFTIEQQQGATLPANLLDPLDVQSVAENDPSLIVYRFAHQQQVWDGGEHSSKDAKSGRAGLIRLENGELTTPQLGPRYSLVLNKFNSLPDHVS